MKWLWRTNLVDRLEACVLCPIDEEEICLKCLVTGRVAGSGMSSPQSQSDSSQVNISTSDAGNYENVNIDTNILDNNTDPFEGFEEAIKNSEVIKIKKVSH